MVFLGCLLLTLLLLSEAWALDMNCESGKFGIDCRGTCHCKSQKDCDSYGTCQNQCELDWDGPTCQRHNIIPDKYRIYKCGYLKVPVKIILQKSQKIHNLYFDIRYTSSFIEILISVNETSPAKWCFGKVLAQPTGFNCSSVIEGQYIHIYSSKRNIFVCKIKIYECADFFFGDQCKHECHCANKSEVCNKTNGLCPSSGCPGWYSDCFTKCPDYSFGNNCSKQCHCLNNEICDRVTGLCPSGCSPGWKHMDCGTPCDDFFFAQNCSQECKCLNASEVCDKETGQCQSSCRPGWHGNNSSLACADSSYEHNCSDGCQCNNSSETCGNETEQPVSGCQDDWLGNNCSARLQARKTAMIAGITTGVGTVIVLIFAALVVVRRRQRKTCRRRDQVMTDETYYKSLSTRGTNQKSTQDDNENNQRDEASCASMYINTNLDVEMYVNAGSVAMVSNMESSIDKTGEAVKMVDLFEHVKTKRSSPSDLFDEYKNLPEGPVKKCQVGKLMENKFKNRFRNIIPYDDTRVVLQPDSDDSQSDYINASLIYGYNSRVRYIASQGVLATSLKDFWRMVWQQDCGKIVMLTNLFENGTIKCEQYWPDEHKKSYGSITVKLICCQEFADFKIRKFSVSKLNVNEVKTVEQFHFTTWTDHSLLKIPGKLVVFYQKIINAQSQQTGPILVHCSAGIGRTGIFLALDYLVSQAAADGVVDFFGCVHKLLQQKAVLIQNELQYAFLHDVVVEAVLFSGNTIPLQDFPAVFQQLGKHDLIKEFEDILKFAVIICVVILAFMVGLYNLYWYYPKDVRKKVEFLPNDIITNAGETFGILDNTFRTVFWSLFGRGESSVVELGEFKHYFTQNVGYWIFGAYNVSTVIVLLNMLIAMMTRSFENIQEEADTEWKFARSKLYMEYIRAESTVPVPFNIIPTFKSVFYMCRFFVRLCCKREEPKIIRHPGRIKDLELYSMPSGRGISTMDASAWERDNCHLKGIKHFQERMSTTNGFVRNDSDPNIYTQKLTYQRVMKRIVKRYIFDMQRENDITEGDFDEIKQDISSFRYEMLNHVTTRQRETKENVEEMNKLQAKVNELIIQQRVILSLVQQSSCLCQKQFQSLDLQETCIHDSTPGEGSADVVLQNCVLTSDSLYEYNVSDTDICIQLENDTLTLSESSSTSKDERL